MSIVDTSAKFPSFQSCSGMSNATCGWRHHRAGSRSQLLGLSFSGLVAGEDHSDSSLIGEAITVSPLIRRSNCGRVGCGNGPSMLPGCLRLYHPKNTEPLPRRMAFWSLSGR
jgi:hypothetical protein